jgi:putative oxidoreductase
MLFAWYAVLTNFFGGILLVLGFLARPAALLNSITMCVAAFVHYKGDVFGAGFMPAVFFAMTLGLTLAGPGRISIDYGLCRTTEGARAKATAVPEA